MGAIRLNRQLTGKQVTVHLKDPGRPAVIGQVAEVNETERRIVIDDGDQRRPLSGNDIAYITHGVRLRTSALSRARMSRSQR